MHRRSLALFAILSAVPTLPASAAPTGTKVSAEAERSSYSRGFGSKMLVSARLGVSVGRNAVLTLTGTRGERRTNGHSFRGGGVAAMLDHPLAAGLTSRTTISIGHRGPLFASRVASQELSSRWQGFTLRAGMQTARYAAGTDVPSFRGAVERQLGPFRLAYGLAAFRSRRATPGGATHRLALDLADHGGSTSLRIGAGDTLHEHDWREEKIVGTFRSLGLKRKTKLGKSLAVDLGSEVTRFERPKGAYSSIKLGVGLSVTR